MAFLAPGLLMLAASAAWMILMRPDEAGSPAGGNEGAQPRPLLRFIMESGLLLAGFVCLLHSIVRDSISVWGPLMLSESFAMPFQATLDFFALVPILNLIGIALAGWLRAALGGRFRKSLLVLFSVCGASSLAAGLALNMGFIASLAALAACSASVMGINSVLLASLPMRYSSEGRVSSAAGFLDFTAYMGAAVSSPLMGFLGERGWRFIPFAWAGVCCLAMFALRWLKKLERNE
jgi:OPA family glycerol-3-phosphate transporter-like MFS transporter